MTRELCAKPKKNFTLGIEFPSRTGPVTFVTCVSSLHVRLKVSECYAIGEASYNLSVSLGQKRV